MLASIAQRRRIAPKPPLRIAVLPENAPNSDYYPWDYRRQHNSMELLAQQRRSHIHPRSGPERAFGQTLREVRVERGLSQEELALEGGFDRTYISLLERGVQSPTLRTVFKLSEVLQTQPSEIIRRTETRIEKKIRPNA
jgi:DNA-binding XRE family transcriptional regulator